MNSKYETISKFLSELKVDTIKEIQYVGKYYSGKCVCGQPILYGYKFKNNRNNRSCLVGKNCLPYIADYLGWNK